MDGLMDGLVDGLMDAYGSCNNNHNTINTG